jgi:transcriptional regulator with XRE-family HTH domain
MRKPPATPNPDGATGAPTAQRMVLGAQLRRLREAAGISRADAGYHIRGSESKMSRLELGRVGFKERDVADLLTLYGVGDPSEREAMLAMVKRSNEPGWWQRYHDLMPAWFHDYVGLEESASRIQTFELQFVPGLLQTEDYARAIAGHGAGRRAAEEVEQRVALRMRRQRVLTRPGAPRLWAFLDEAVLRRPIGGPRVMRAQLKALLEWSSLPHVALQALPYERGGRAAEGAFTVLRFAEPELPDIVYIEHLTGALYLDKRDEIEPYSRALDRLAVDSETPAHTRQMIEKIRAEI